MEKFNLDPPGVETRAQPLDLAAIKAREAAATTTGMRLTRYEHGGGRLVQFVENPRPFGSEDRHLIADFYDEANREFYYHARQDIPALIAEVERLRALAVDPAVPQLWELVEWMRAEAAKCDTFHATMGTGYHASADRLAALLPPSERKGT